MATRKAWQSNAQQPIKMEWKFSPKQLLLMYWYKTPRLASCAGVIADGAVRSGKTIALAFGFLMWATETFNGQNFALCGKTIKSFERNVLGPMKLIVRYLGYTLIERKHDNRVIISNSDGHVNNFFLFGGNDEKSQDLIQGITLAGVLLDEVALMPESFVNQALARLSVTGAKIWMNCNPEGPSHFVKTRFIDKYQEKQLLHVHFRLSDNLALSEERREFYDKQWTGVFYRRYILGEWCLASGLVFSSFDPETMVFDNLGPDLWKYSAYFVAGDYGTTNPTAVLVIGYSADTGTFDVIDEYYWSSKAMGRQKTDDEYVADISALAAKYPIKAAYFDPSAASLITALRKARVFPRLWLANNDVLNGIRFTSMLFSLGKIRISSKCKNLIRELQSYSWDEEKSEKTGEDVVLKINDHTCDALRYFCYSEVYVKAKSYGLGNIVALAGRMGT